MKYAAKIIAILLLAIICTIIFCSCSKKKVTPVKPENFRVTAYVVCNKEFDVDTVDPKNFSNTTDIIVIGNARFDEKGNIILDENFDNSINLLKEYLTGQNLYLNILGPASQSTSEDWNEQMYDQADRHNLAFKSGNLEGSIKNVLEKYAFDGVVFDYEFPLRSEDWKIYDSFILSLRQELGNEYKIGMSMVSWNLKQSKAAREATDLFEVMSYDLWDDDGYHATLELAQKDIDEMIKKGYDPAKLDSGIPFYARPTTQEAYWYEYKYYYDKLSEDGLYKDDETGLTFSFNTYDMVYEKTKWAISKGLGGVMVWHYGYDLPYANKNSLFRAIDEAKQEAIINY